MPDRCMNCGEMSVDERMGSFDVVQGILHETIPDRHMRCEVCGNISYWGDQISAHELAVAAKLREMDGLLSTRELINIRTKYKLTQREMEMALGTGPKTWIRWERGKVVQSKIADRMIRALSEQPELLRKMLNDGGVTNLDAIAVLDGFLEDEKRLVERVLRERHATGLELDFHEMAGKVVDVVHSASESSMAKAA